MRRKSNTAVLHGTTPKKHPSVGPYPCFDTLNGLHPWMKVMPEGHITYQVRELRQGKVIYFNYELAKEMGLIPEEHPHEMNSKLEQACIKNFSLQIINEYDLIKKKKFDPATIKPHRYMASRYLQLQHSNKKGKTSGDGRGIWNGIIEHKGKTWDVSSRGTGVTILSPGFSEIGKYLRTGGNSVGYGCGLAEMDELLGAAVMSDIFHKKGINTERVLCVIDLGKGVGIGVRAASNLLRPAHLFLHLKQNNFDALKRGTDYFIERQEKNKEWPIALRKKDRYNIMLERLAVEFAKFSARLASDYIFLWMDWDGDNLLANAGIIDYGSIRQFGLRHDQYRYDDVSRYSTSLNEQRVKARQTVQVFAQLVDYLNTGKKRAVEEYKNHSMLKVFDRTFYNYKLELFLEKMGYEEKQIKILLKDHAALVKRAFQEFRFLEGVKTYKKTKEVADGINRPPIFNLRKLLRDLPCAYLNDTKSFSASGFDAANLHEMMLAETTKGKDKELTSVQKPRILQFQKYYLNLLKKAFSKEQILSGLQSIARNTSHINHPDRITGNSMTNLVEEILSYYKKGLSIKEVQRIIEAFVAQQSFGLEQSEAAIYLSNKTSKELLSQIFTIVEEHSEDI